jgi:hypothetical protein
MAPPLELSPLVFLSGVFPIGVGVGRVDVDIGTEAVMGSESVGNTVLVITRESQTVEASDGTMAETVICGAVES